MSPLTRAGEAQCCGGAIHLSRGRARSVRQHLVSEMQSDDAMCRSYPTAMRRKMNLLGKLDWSAIPFDQPIIMAHRAAVPGHRVDPWWLPSGYVPYCAE